MRAYSRPAVACRTSSAIVRALDFDKPALTPTETRSSSPIPLALSVHRRGMLAVHACVAREIVRRRQRPDRPILVVKVREVLRMIVPVSRQHVEAHEPVQTHDFLEAVRQLEREAHESLVVQVGDSMRRLQKRAGGNHVHLARNTRCIGDPIEAAYAEITRAALRGETGELRAYRFRTLWPREHIGIRFRRCRDHPGKRRTSRSNRRHRCWSALSDAPHPTSRPSRTMCQDPGSRQQRARSRILEPAHRSPSKSQDSLTVYSGTYSSAPMPLTPRWQAGRWDSRRTDRCREIEATDRPANAPIRRQLSSTHRTRHRADVAAHERAFPTEG